MIRSIGWLVLFGLAVAPAASDGQMGYQANSLEWLVADSEIVVRATIARVERVLMPDPNPEFHDPPRFWETVTLQVGETIKGDRVDSLTFAWERMESDHRFEGWRDAGREAVWLLKTVKRRTPGDRLGQTARGLEPCAAGGGLIRLGPAVTGERSHSPPIFSMDLTVLREPAEILAAARRAVREENKTAPARAYRLGLGSGELATGFGGDANSLEVPNDARLEPVARQLIRSPVGYLRLEGVKALRDFKSAENIALLRTLLDDPLIYGINRPTGPTKWTYVVRQAAYEDLRAWDVAVPAPVLEGPEPHP